MKKLTVILLCAALLLSLGAIGFTASAAEETVLYVKDGGTGDGTSEANAFGDFKTAFEAAAALTGDAKLVVVGTVTVPLTASFVTPTFTHVITVVGKDETSTLHFNNDASSHAFHFSGDTVIDDITLTAEKPTTTIVFCANLHNVTFGPGFKSTAAMGLRGTYKHSEDPGKYGFNEDKTAASASYTLTVMGGSNWGDIAGYAQNSSNCNLTGDVTINVGGSAVMNTVCVVRNALVTVTNATVNVYGAVINRFIGATDRDPVAHMGYNDTNKTVEKPSGVTGTMTVNIYPEFDVSKSFTNLSNNNILVPGISGTSIYILSNSAPEKGMTDVVALGNHILNVDKTIFDAVSPKVQAISFDAVNNVDLSNGTGSGSGTGSGTGSGSGSGTGTPAPQTGSSLPAIAAIAAVSLVLSLALLRKTRKN
ncbi:MAG: LPXTG cell wall anchor domain-containing protein [Clostridia bacterium]|nr:LPXTG cell wall anchor domain-containing protein [Clostridia bacterium]